MIRLLKGTIELQDGPHLLIEVNGVGYHVYATKDLLSRSAVGDKVKVFTYMHVRDDLLELYGFVALEDLKLFEQFLTVSGIGPKTAISIFAIGSRDKIIHAIATGDIEFFASVPRLGRKNAQKLLIELKNKVGSVDGIDMYLSNGIRDTEVIEALKNFGFSAREAQEAIRSLDPKITDISDKVRLALKYLGK